VNDSLNIKGVPGNSAKEALPHRPEIEQETIDSGEKNDSGDDIHRKTDIRENLLPTAYHLIMSSTAWASVGVLHERTPQTLQAETLATRATALCIRVGKFEPAGNQPGGIIEVRPFEVKGTLGIHNNPGATGFNEDVSPFRFVNEPHPIAQPVAPPPGNSNPQVTAGLIARDEVLKLPTGGIRHANQLFVTLADAIR